MHKKFPVLLFIALFILGRGIAQSVDIQKLDSLFSLLSAHQKAMGGVAVMQRGEIIYQRNIGYDVLEEGNKKQSTINSKYRIGSVTKMFTATLMMQLIEENKIGRETKLSRFFPLLPNAEKITIDHLLSHQSGLYNFTSDPGYSAWMTKGKSRKELIELIGSKPPGFEPGEQYEYSNSNYVLLGYIIEQIYGKPYSEVLEEKITKQISLSHTYYGSKTDVDTDEVFSYYFIQDVWKKAEETEMSIPHGAGALVSTPSDLVRFAESLFSYRLLSKKGVEAMTGFSGAYGLGITVFPFNDQKGYGHDGVIDGFSSILIYFPEERLSIAYCTNGQNYPMNEILIGILNICFDKPYALPSFNTMMLQPADLKQYEGIYTSEDIPIQIKAYQEDGRLKIEPEGQDAFYLDAMGDHLFRFDQAGIVIEFFPQQHEFILKQAGQQFRFASGQ